MAKKSSIEKNNRRMKLVKKFAARRANVSRPSRSDMDAGRRWTSALRRTLKLAQLPRNSSRCACSQPLRTDGPSARISTASTRISAASPCAISAHKGLIPGLVKSSW